MNEYPPVGNDPMQKVVYVLGAGFSAPLGLPLMSNFLFKSKDMFAAEPEKFDYFKDIFDTIRYISVAKGYFETNTFNIEEILSILEMDDYLNGQKLRQEFVKYIVDVVSYYTPPMRRHSGGPPGNWEASLFGSSSDYNAYAYFCCALLNLRASAPENNHGTGWVNHAFDKEIENTTHYAVITLNYDLILENVCNFINKTFPHNARSEKRVGFSESSDGTLLAKLHGSADKGDIVPPTWSKGVVTSVSPAWKAALEALSNATQIRILGYSLPVADAYVKYLFKAAVIRHQHVQKIDVIGLDGDGSLERRFREFIKFDYLRFQNGDVADYLESNMKLTRRGNSTRIVFNKLEDAHERFMKGDVVKSWHQ